MKSREPEPWPSLHPGGGLPGTRAGPARGYGWTGHSLGARAGLHRVIETSQTQLTFEIADDCFAFGIDAEPEPVTVAGLDGLYVVPYEDPDVLFYHRGSRGAETTGGYALAIDDRTLCVYLTWDLDTPSEELRAARQGVESIRAQPFGQEGIRINFTLPRGWDTG